MSVGHSRRYQPEALAEHSGRAGQQLLQLALDALLLERRGLVRARARRPTAPRADRDLEPVLATARAARGATPSRRRASSSTVGGVIQLSGLTDPPPSAHTMKVPSDLIISSRTDSGRYGRSAGRVGDLAAGDDQAHRATVSSRPVRPAVELAGAGGLRRRTARAAAAASVAAGVGGWVVAAGVAAVAVGGRSSGASRRGARAAGGACGLSSRAPRRRRSPRGTPARRRRARRASSGRRLGPSTSRATMPMKIRWIGLSMPICPSRLAPDGSSGPRPQGPAARTASRGDGRGGAYALVEVAYEAPAPAAPHLSPAGRPGVDLARAHRR